MNVPLIIFIVVILVFIYVLFSKQIMSFIQPGKWLKLIILEKDNNIKSRLIKKGKQNTFNFKKGMYNLFYGESKSSVYRIGRLGCFVYVEDNENPVDLREIKATGNPLLNTMIINQRVDELWYETNDQRDLIVKIIIGVLIVGVVILIAMAFIKGQNPSV